MFLEGNYILNPFRQALDRGAALLNVSQIVTGHNAGKKGINILYHPFASILDDIAETVLMNLLRGDLPRLQRYFLSLNQ